MSRCYGEMGKEETLNELLMQYCGLFRLLFHVV